MKTMTQTLGIIAASLLLVKAAAADVTFSDNTFTNGDWTLTQVQGGGGGATSAGQQLAGGNPGSFRAITNTVNAVANSFIRGIHLNTNAIYTPAIAGAISSIDYAEDSILVSGFGQGQGTGPALQQGGINYVVINGLGTPNSTWTHQSLAGLTVTNFGQLTSNGVIATNNPNFSCSGTPITFGFSRANSTPTASGYTTIAGIDNWTNTIHSTTPCNCTFDDIVFNNSDWTLIQIAGGGGGSTTAGQQLAGGNGGSFRAITNTVNAVANSFITSIHLKNNAIWTLASQGPITSINYSEDSILITGFAQGEGAGPALQQGGTNYVLINEIITPSFNWTHQSLVGLTATAFGQITTSGVNASSNPDFTCGAAPIKFGFFRANSTPTANGYTDVGGIDNWCVYVNSNLNLTITKCVSICWQGCAGAHYTIQSAPTPNGPWSTMATVIGVNGNNCYTDTVLNNNNYYRATNP